MGRGRMTTTKQTLKATLIKKKIINHLLGTKKGVGGGQGGCCLKLGPGE